MSLFEDRSSISTDDIEGKPAGSDKAAHVHPAGHKNVFSNANTGFDGDSLPFLNVSGYRFIDLDIATLPSLREELLKACQSSHVRGTILLSPEGINLMLCGPDAGIALVERKLRAHEPFRDLWLKPSRSSEMTYTRMLVKIKSEIIPTGDPAIRPAEKTGRYLSPEDLRRWYEEERDFVILDTRNDYELQIGRFERAMDLGLSSFRSLRKKLQGVDPEIRSKPIVTYCTGGVRCEKVTPIMMQMGFMDVYQLEGGIINYFERCGDAFFDGECFVFDKRVAIDGQLRETPTTQCYRCQAVLTEEDQRSPMYEPGVCCPYCPAGRMADDAGT